MSTLSPEELAETKEWGISPQAIGSWPRDQILERIERVKAHAHRVGLRLAQPEDDDVPEFIQGPVVRAENARGYAQLAMFRSLWKMYRKRESPRSHLEDFAEAIVLTSDDAAKNLDLQMLEEWKKLISRKQTKTQLTQKTEKNPDL